jgi:hypothetical protein
MATAKAKAPTLDGAASRLTFNARGHSYKLDGQPIDGVTTLIGDGMRKKALENWAGNETAAYAVNHWEELSVLPVAARLEKLKKARFEVRDNAARKGTEVHRLAEQIIAGVEVDVPEELAGHVRSAVAFLDEWQIRPVLTETKVWSEKGRYGGTLDMVVTSDLMPGVVALADWKTSRSGIYGETALQLSAYENADCYIGDDGLDHPMSELGINACWGVWIRSDGYSVYPMERGEQVFRTFQFVATVARRTEGPSRPLDQLKGEELYRPAGAAA